MKVITFPTEKASVQAKNGTEGLLLSLFRTLPECDQDTVLNVVKIAVKHKQKREAPPKRVLSLV